MCLYQALQLVHFIFPHRIKWTWGQIHRCLRRCSCPAVPTRDPDPHSHRRSWGRRRRSQIPTGLAGEWWYGLFARQLGDGLHRERRSLLHRVSEVHFKAHFIMKELQTYGALPVALSSFTDCYGCLNYLCVQYCAH